MNVQEVRAWIETNVPRPWIEAGRRGGAARVRTVRTRAEYEEWYPVFAASGLVVPTWPVPLARLRSTSFGWQIRSRILRRRLPLVIRSR